MNLPKYSDKQIKVKFSDLHTPSVLIHDLVHQFRLSVVYYVANHMHDLRLMVAKDIHLG